MLSRVKMIRLMVMMVMSNMSNAFSLSLSLPMPLSVNRFGRRNINRRIRSRRRVWMTENSIPSMESESEYTSTLTLLDHVSLSVPKVEDVLPLYVDLLGFGLPNLDGDGSVRPTCGVSQIHFSRERDGKKEKGGKGGEMGGVAQKAQGIGGSIGLRYESLEGIKRRLRESEAENENASERPFLSYEIGVDESSKREHIRIVDRNGNVLYCRQKSIQNISSIKGAETECGGIDYLEFHVPYNTAHRIAQFYDCLFDADTTVLPLDAQASTNIAIVAFGSIDPQTGSSSQTLLFREMPDGHVVTPCEGHSIGIYVGQNAPDFRQAFQNVEQCGILWINPHIVPSEKTTTWNGAKKWNQFRFKNIIDINTGKTIFQLEHLVRSVQHHSWPGKT